MTALAAAALSIAVGCGFTDTLARHAAAITMRENPKLDPKAINRNTNGTDDRGLTQINTVNYDWLSLAMHKPINAQTILDPCTNLEAGLRVEFVKYNGNPPPLLAAAYSTRALDSARAVDSVAEPVTPPPALPPPCAPAWDAWALAACSQKPRAIVLQETAHAQ